jgi:hypothetical protein
LSKKGCLCVGEGVLSSGTVDFRRANRKFGQSGGAIRRKAPAKAFDRVMDGLTPGEQGDKRWSAGFGVCGSATKILKTGLGFFGAAVANASSGMRTFPESIIPLSPGDRRTPKQRPPTGETEKPPSTDI